MDRRLHGLHHPFFLSFLFFFFFLAEGKTGRGKHLGKISTDGLTYMIPASLSPPRGDADGAKMWSGVGKSS